MLESIDAAANLPTAITYVDSRRGPWIKNPRANYFGLEEKVSG